MTSPNIGRYVIEQMLGQGGMATVFLARDPFMKRQVAIKVLPQELTADPQFRARFQREAEIIATLEHGHIVPVYDFGHHENQPYLVMRYMTGGSLDARLSDRPFSLEETINILSPLASALDYAHGRGVVHRDLKPANIMFDSQGESYVADFGIAKLAEANTRLTRTGIMGTPAYMSPEQWRGGNEVIDGRSDIYALGIMLYEMLSGQLPFEVDTPAQMMYRHLIEPPARLLDKIPSLPSRCENVIAQALAKKREDRFATATELVQALKGPTRPYPKLVSESDADADAPPPPKSSIDEVVEIIDTSRLAVSSDRSEHGGPPRVYVPRSSRIQSAAAAASQTPSAPPAPATPAAQPSPTPPVEPAVTSSKEPSQEAAQGQPSSGPAALQPAQAPAASGFGRHLVWLVPVGIIWLCLLLTIVVGILAAWRMWFANG